jgi:hypothetical protein
VDIIKMDLVGTGWGGVDCIGLAQNTDNCWAVIDAVMNLRDQLNAGELSGGYTTDGLCVVLSIIELVQFR